MRFFTATWLVVPPVDQLRAQNPFNLAEESSSTAAPTFVAARIGRREVSDRCSVPLPREPPQLCHDFDPFEVRLRLQDTCAHTPPPDSVLLSSEHVTPRRPAVSRQSPP